MARSHSGREASRHRSCEPTIAWSAGPDKESLIKAAQAALDKAKRAEKHKDL